MTNITISYYVRKIIISESLFKITRNNTFLISTTIYHFQAIYDCVSPTILQRSMFPASELPTLPMRPPRRMQQDMMEGHAHYDTPPRSPSLMNGRSLDDGGKITRF